VVAGGEKEPWTLRKTRDVEPLNQRRIDTPITICYSCNIPQHPMADTSRFGFVAFAETWNGRLAMLGFVIGLGTELLTGQGILSQLGLS
jgi:hypothetical protein